MRSVILILLAFVSNCSLAQTNLSGVVNQYYSVTGVNYVSNTLTLSQTTGIAVGDTLLLIQMKGATINNSNSASYGTTTFYNGAGVNELVEVCDIQGNEITLKKRLIYTLYASGNGLQLIQFPSLGDININGTITCDPWNGSTGGVVFLRSNGTIALNSNIDVSGLGFRGGSHFNSPFSCNWILNLNNYEYNVSTGQGAEKGEGIANYPTNRGGRGALANGGGGGNDHNTGGGGGGNISSGGNGGINDEPGTFLCDGDGAGVGGKPLATIDGRIFLGGGGGTGHSNSNFNNQAGNGGGIVILLANEIQGNGNSILSNGTDGLRGFGDGGSGGGAGGTVLVLANQFSGLNVSVNGGNGGNGNGGWLNDDGTVHNNNETERCFGPGGGGAGGLIWFQSGTTPAGVTTSLTGGSHGVVTNSQQNSCLGNANGATNGTNGVQQYNGTLQQSVKLNKMCSTNPVLDLGTDTTVCSGILTISSNLTGSYNWSTGATTPSIDVTSSGTYALEVDLGGCFICDTIVVTMRTLEVDLGPDQTICDGSILRLDAGIPGASYQWSTTEISQTIAVDKSGTYSVIVSDGNCTHSDDIQITVVPNPIPLSDSAELCSYQGVMLDAENPGAMYNWSTGASSSTITVNEPGTFSVEINYGGNCSIIENIEVIACENNLFVPNTFTPNGDTFNDTWMIRGLVAYPGNKVWVYNRNGSLVYEATNYDGSWTGDNLPEAAYFYLLDLNNGGNVLEGTVSIVR